jgi:hypothetical protein
MPLLLVATRLEAPSRIRNCLASFCETGAAELEAKVQALTEKVEQLTCLLKESRRAGKRQAAPFAKNPPKRDPQKPGRKADEDYGVKAYRQPPAPEQIDEEDDALSPDSCPILR